MSRKQGIIAAAICVIFAAAVIYVVTPITVMSATGVNRTEPANCSIIVDSLAGKTASGACVVLRDDRLEQLLALFGSAKVKRVGSTSVDHYSVDTVRYVLYFEDPAGKVVRVDVRSDGYLFCDTLRYKLQPEKETALIGFLRECVSSSENLAKGK